MIAAARRHGRRRRPRLDAVPVLRAEGGGLGARAATSSQARIVQTVTGGGFGGKEDAPSAPGAQVALLAQATGRPGAAHLHARGGHGGHVQAPSRAHPHAHGRHRATGTWSRLRGGLPARRRRLRDAVAGGALPRHRPRLRALPRAQRARWTRARCARTRCPAGAFRGFGEPQVVFACESQMDLLAERLGMDPLELRRRNALRRRRRDDHRPQARRPASASREVLDKVAAAADWRAKRAALRAATRGRCAAGIGLAACYYGVGLGAMGKHLNPAGASVVVAARRQRDGGRGHDRDRPGHGHGAVARSRPRRWAVRSSWCASWRPTPRACPTAGPPWPAAPRVMSGNAIRDAAAKIRAAMEPVIADSGLSWRGRGRAVRAEAGRPGRPRLGRAARDHLRPRRPARARPTSATRSRPTWSRSRSTPRPARRACSRVVVRPRRGPRRQPHHRRGPGRGRRRAGPRLRAGRGARACGRPHPQRPVLDLHHPDHRSTRRRSSPILVEHEYPWGPVRGQGPGRDADHRGGARGDGRHPPRDRACACTRSRPRPSGCGRRCARRRRPPRG